MAAPLTITMFPNIETLPCKACTLGETAFTLLSTGQSGKVLASVSQAVYLVTRQGDLLWLAGPAIPLHPRGVRVPIPLPHPNAGAPYHVKDGFLMTASGATLDFGSSVVWKTPELPAGDAVPLTRLPGIVTNACHYFLEWPKPDGMGNLIPAILQMLVHPSQSEDADKGLNSLVDFWPPVKGITLACFRRDLDLLLEHAAKLVGLGSGLTPSGDDFLGGLFFSFELLRRIYPEIPELQTWNFANFILQCKSRTNLISFNLMEDHARGHAMEPLHSFANALLTDQSADQFLPPTGDLVVVGHSTGWDILTGFLVGMSITFAP